MTDFEPWRARRETFEIVIRNVDLDWGSTLEVVEFRLGGRDFTDLVAESEVAGCGELGRAGRYLGLTRSDINWAQHLLGRSTDDQDDERQLDGRTLLMGCICSVWGCNPLYARITSDESSVFWHDFHNPFRDWTYQTLGPFRFDRREYEAELTRLGR